MRVGVNDLSAAAFAGGAVVVPTDTLEVGCCLWSTDPLKLGVEVPDELGQVGRVAVCLG
jgi:hypothetical protein